MSSMRGIDTPVRQRRRRVFKEVANLAYNSTNLKDDMEALPYKIVDYEESEFWESVYRDRAIIRERIRLAMGMSLRPENREHPGHLTQGLEESNIDEKYYEPPLMQVIPSACNACPENRYEVTSSCMGCLAHPCQSVCPKGAISMKNGKSVIDQEKCIKCGKCREICPYDAICHKERPCKAACGIGAITSDHVGRAVIDNEKCVSCGQCMVSCPFGAIADKSQIFQLIRAMQSGRKIIAQVAPAFAGQFGPKVTPEMFKTALKELGFADVYETALGADMGCMAEAEHYVKEVATGKQQFALTSCCPSWSVMAKNLFPETIDKISNELTPMVATARLIKQEHPDASVVFIGPCASKKLEASRKSIRSYVDFVLTFEEVAGMFDAKGVDWKDIPEGEPLFRASADGRGFAVSGGVAEAVVHAVKRIDPDREVKVMNAEGLQNCKKMLQMAKIGKYNGYLLEGMACPGGCVAGAGTIQTVKKAAAALEKMKKEASFTDAYDSKYRARLESLEKFDVE